MKKKVLMLAVLALISAMILSLSACTDPDQPGTDEPDTAQPQTSVGTSGDDLKTSEPDTAQPQTENVERPVIGEVTQENVTEAFLPSLECYVYYLGSYLYDIEYGEDGRPLYYDDMYMHVLDYNDFESLRADMSKYVSDDLIYTDGVKEVDGKLFVQYPQRGTNWVFDITSIELLESDGDNYKIGVDYAYSEFNTDIDSDTIIDIYKSSFNATLKDGVLVIESFEEGDLYTVEEIKSDTPAEDRRWIGELDKIFSEEPTSLPYDTKLK